jgi:DNA-directed RNA polymerase specialized sigma subunit
MEVEKGKTFKYLRGKREVSQSAKDNLKQFIRIKKEILEALSDKEMNIVELTETLKIPKHEVVFYLMTLIKYGNVKVGDIDDMDEYYNYKLNK